MTNWLRRCFGIDRWTRRKNSQGIHGATINGNVYQVMDVQGDVILATHQPTNDPSIDASPITPKQALSSTVETFRRRVSSVVPSFGVAVRPHTDQLHSRLLDEDCPQIVVCEGAAGTGKSTVAADVLSRLTHQGWPAAAVGVDGVEVGIRTSRALGGTLGLATSPSTLLAQVASGDPAVLLVDQLDAVSTYSGRMPDTYQAVDEMLSELTDQPNIKIILVARSVDIDRDPRLSSLVSNKERVERFQVGDLDDDSVADILAANEVDTAALDPATLRLPRVPIHLSVFSRLSLPAQTASYRTLQELYTRYTEEQRIAVEERLKSVTWNKATSSLISWMSEHEALTAPIGTLDDYAQRDVGVLESAGVLIRVGNDRVAFFHETYFDFLFARGFVSSGRDLHEFLASSGQHLFRRAQTRQVLEYLSETDRIQFRNVAVRLLTSQQIRPHLIDVLISVLRQIRPTKEDWHAIESLAWTPGRLSSKVRGLLSMATWFDAADHDGRWERWLSDPLRRDAIFPEFLLAARLRPERVEELVRPYLGSSGGWDRILVGLIEWSLNPGLIDLAINLVDRGILDEARGPVASNSDFWSLLHTPSDENPVGASQLIGAYLRRHLARSKSDGSGDPFESGHLDSHSQAAGKVLENASGGAPAEFIKETLGFVIDVAAAGMGRGSGIYASGGRWAFLHKGSYGVDSGIFTAIDSAIQRLPAADQAAADLTINRLTSIVNPAREIRFLTCRLYSALGRPDEATRWLLSDEKNLQLGFADNLRWTSRELIRSATLE